MFTPKHGDELMPQLRRASLVTVPAAGHDGHLDAPQDWTRTPLGSSAR
jgi:hypothetical protein